MNQFKLDLAFQDWDRLIDSDDPTVQLDKFYTIQGLPTNQRNRKNKKVTTL